MINKTGIKHEGGGIEKAMEVLSNREGDSIVEYVFAFFQESMDDLAYQNIQGRD